ncbi:hypothetical protein V5O48_019239, partial [Marasmius crinis-equi]
LSPPQSGHEEDEVEVSDGDEDGENDGGSSKYDDGDDVDDGGNGNDGNNNDDGGDDGDEDSNDGFEILDGKNDKEAGSGEKFDFTEVNAATYSDDEVPEQPKKGGQKAGKGRKGGLEVTQRTRSGLTKAFKAGTPKQSKAAALKGGLGGLQDEDIEDELPENVGETGKEQTNTLVKIVNITPEDASKTPDDQPNSAVLKKSTNVLPKKS